MSGKSSGCRFAVVMVYTICKRRTECFDLTHLRNNKTAQTMAQDYYRSVPRMLAPRMFAFLYASY